LNSNSSIRLQQGRMAVSSRGIGHESGYSVAADKRRSIQCDSYNGCGERNAERNVKAGPADAAAGSMPGRDE
jgi:hypothetical protein